MTPTDSDRKNAREDAQWIAGDVLNWQDVGLMKRMEFRIAQARTAERRRIREMVREIAEGPPSGCDANPDMSPAINHLAGWQGCSRAVLELIDPPDEQRRTDK